MMKIHHIQVKKDTGEIVDFWASGIPVPEIPEDNPFAIYPISPENMVDDGIINGQIYNIETGMVEDTQLSINLKAETELQKSDWMVNRHRDQKDLGVPTSLTDQDYIELLKWRQHLRDAVQ